MTFVDPGNPHDLATRVARSFRELFGSPAQVVGRAPGRVNLIGEHTDYNAGLCLPLALPHATYAALGVRDDDRVRIASRQSDTTWEATLDALGPGQVTGWPAYVAGVLWALREAGHAIPGMEILVDGRVPLGAGLSSSAALECAVAVGTVHLLGRELDEALRRELVTACMRAEAEVAGAPTGGMDQTVALLAEPGAALLIDFSEHSAVPVPLSLADAGLALLVTDTRVSHALVDGGYASRREECEAAVAALGVGSLREADLAAVDRLDDDVIRRRARHIVTEIDRVTRAVAAIGVGDWTEVGGLFLDSHASMRDDFEISCAELDLVVTTTVESGAVGARMTGGGFGGSAISLVPLARVEAVVRAVDTAFVAAGFAPPAHLLAEASGAADVLGSPSPAA